MVFFFLLAFLSSVYSKQNFIALNLCIQADSFLQQPYAVFQIHQSTCIVIVIPTEILVESESVLEMPWQTNMI